MSYRCAADEGKANDAPIQARQVPQPDSCAAPEITEAPLSDDSSTNMRRSASEEFASEEFAIDTIYPSSPANDRAIDACWPEHAARPPPPQRMPSRIGRNLANRVVMLLSDPLQYKIGNRFHSADEIPELELEREADKLRQALRDCAADYNVDVELQVRIATVDALTSAITLGARVIHFAGHSMMFEDGHGSAKQLEPETLRLLVSAGGAGACRLVVVNSCQSETHGRAFVDAGVEHVVAVAQDQNDGRISDRAARAFCRSFYLSLVLGDSVRRAFEVGCASAQEKMTGPLATQRLFVLLPEDKPHDEPIFSPIPGTFRETTPSRPPSNAPPPPTFYVGRATDQLRCVESIIRYRLTTIGGPYGSGKSALAMSTAAYASRRRRFDAVVWVEATTQERFFDDVIEAAEHVIEKVQRDAVADPSSRPTLRNLRSTLSSSEAPSAGGRVRRRSRTWSLDDNGSLEDEGMGLDTNSALGDLARMGKVLVVLNDFERLVVSVPSQQLQARARCRRLLSSLLKCGGARCSSNIRVLMTCSSGSGIGLVPGVTEGVITLGPLAPDKTALMLLYRDRELLRRAHNPYADLPPKLAPRPVVAMCSKHPLMKRLKGLPRAVDLAVRILNLLFAAEEAAKDACEAAGASKMKPPQSLEPLDRVLRVLDDDDGEREIRVAKRLIRKIGGDSDSLRAGDKVEADYRELGKFYPGRISRDRGDDTYDISYEQKLEESDLRQHVDELNYMVQHGRGYRPDGTPVSPASPASSWAPPPEFQLDAPVSPSTPAPASPWALGLSVEPRQLAFALAAVWGVRLAADAAERGALDALVLNVRLDAVVHLVLDVLAVALLYEARR